MRRARVTKHEFVQSDECETKMSAARSFIHGDPQVATEAHLKAHWDGGSPGERFRCYLCGHRFVLGEYWRCQYTNSTPGAGGNPLVCKACDGPDVTERWKAAITEANTRFWWAFPCGEEP